MNLGTFRAAVAATLLAGTGLALTAAPALAQTKEEKAAAKAAAAAAAANKPNYTKAVIVALQAAQKAQQAGDFPTATAQAQAADAAKVTPDDNLAVGQTKINIGIGTKDNAMIEAGLEQALSSGKVAATEVPKYWRNLGALAIQKNDYNKAIRAYVELEKVLPANGETAVSLAEMYQKTKQTPLAVASFNRAVAAKRAAGEAVPEPWYRRSLAIAYDAKLPKEILSSSLALVEAYPNPTNWRDSLTIFRDSAKMDDQGMLDIFRLQRAAGALAGERDYAEYAETASLRGLPGEAKTVVDEGVAKSMLSTAKPFVKDLQATLAPRVAKDKASLPALEKEAMGPKGTAKLIAGTADGYFGYNNYTKAATLYKAALAKGADPAATNLRLGASLALAGDKAGATEALNAVKGGPRETLAQFWLAYLSKKA